MTSSTARKRLPVRPSLEHLRKQAKRLARAAQLPLTEAQQRLAGDYGFAGWLELAAHVEAVRDHGEGWRRSASENLPKAANAGDLARVRAILEEGGFTQHDLDLALGRAVLRFVERRAIAELLVEHGADPDGQYGSDYGPIVFVTGECLDADGLQFLIDQGADVGFAPVATKYGAHCPLSYVLSSYVRGRNAARHRAIEILLAHGAHVPAEITPPVMAIQRGDADTLARLLDEDPALATRSFADLPYGNLPLAGGTLLHAAVELGELACLELLVAGGASFAARSGGDGPTPIFHAIATVADGNFETLAHLARHHAGAIDLGVRATWPGQPVAVTPLAYAEQAALREDRGDPRPRLAEELALLRAWPARG